MIRVEVIGNFTLREFEKVSDIKYVESEYREEKGFVVGDSFICDKEMVDYLTGNNPINKTVVKIIEIIPEKEIKEEIAEEKPKAKRTKKSK